MFQVIAYEPGQDAGTLIPTPVVATADEIVARRVYHMSAALADNCGLETTFGLQRHDPAEPTGWKLLATNRPSRREIAPMRAAS